jgi:hypothetical protein
MQIVQPPQGILAVVVNTFRVEGIRRFYSGVNITGAAKGQENANVSV